jgi:hypothetical protein
VYYIRDRNDTVGECRFMLSLSHRTIDNSPVVYCWDKRHIHIRISPVGTTEKMLHEFANSIRNVSLMHRQGVNYAENYRDRRQSPAEG